MKSQIDYFWRSGTDWLFRRRRLGLALISPGILLFAILVSSWIEVQIPIGDAEFSIGMSGEGAFSLGTTLTSLAVLMALVLIAVGAAITISDWRRSRRRKVIAIECRGLRDQPGKPLEQSIPRRISGTPEPLNLNLRQGIRDGEITDPRAALSRLEALPNDLSTRTHGLDRSDFQIVVGALAPVPFLYYLGCILDDEDDVEVLDWDRHSRHWRDLSDFDDGRRFQVDWPEQDLREYDEVILAVSASYEVDVSAAKSVTSDTPCVVMDLAERSTSSHWSKEKQMELGRQFLDTAIRLSDTGIRKIHLFLASPASLAIRLGMLYDRRNLPELHIYQYDRKNITPFPWCLRIPTGHDNLAQILMTESAKPSGRGS